MTHRLYRLFPVFLLAAAALSPVTAARAEDDKTWTDNFEAAKAQAKKEGKDLLLDFTGSDWCPPCKQLHKEILSKDKFKTDAPKSFVLVELDFPQNKALAPEVKEQNELLAAQMKITGFPTIILMDSEGRPYAATSGYASTSEEEYMARLAELQKVKVKRDELLAAAAKLTGVERAKALENIVQELAKSGVNPLANLAWVKEIVTLDAKDEAGLKTKYEKPVRFAEIELMVAAKKYEEGIKAIDQAIADFKATGQELQGAMYLKARCQYRSDHKADALATLHAAVDVDPNSQLARQALRGAIAQIEKEINPSKP